MPVLAYYENIIELELNASNPNAHSNDGKALETILATSMVMASRNNGGLSKCHALVQFIWRVCWELQSGCTLD